MTKLYKNGIVTLLVDAQSFLLIGSSMLIQNKAIFLFPILGFSCLKTYSMEIPSQQLKLAPAKAVHPVTAPITSGVVHAAQEGDAQAQYLMARYHQSLLEKEGVILERNPHLAIEWYQKAASQQHEQAQYCLGQLYLKKKQHEQAYRLFEMAASSGHILAQFELAKYYRLSGLEEAYNLFKKVYESTTSDEIALYADFSQAIKHAQSRSAFFLGQMCEVRGEKDQAHKYYKASYELDRYDKAALAVSRFESPRTANIYLKEAVEAGLPEAIAEWASIQKKEGNVKEAFELYLEAAQKKNAEAQYQVGLYYETGSAGQKNNLAAKTWFKAAAEQGHHGAITSLRKDAEIEPDLMLFFARLCLTGKGLPKSEAHAIDWCMKALHKNSGEAYNLLRELSQNNDDALFALGEFCEQSDNKDIFQALKWYERAALNKHIRAFCRMETLAEQNYPQAALTVAPFYLQGLAGIDQDREKGMLILKQASDRHDAQAAFMLATLYNEGKVVTRDLSKGVSFFQKAFEGGHPKAMAALMNLSQESPLAAYVLGHAYEEGTMVSKDIDEAIRYYKSASKRGCSLAYGALASLCVHNYASVYRTFENIVQCYKDALLCFQMHKHNDIHPAVLEQYNYTRDIFQVIMLEVPNFSNRCLAKINFSSRMSAELYYYIVCITDILSKKFLPKDQKMVSQALINLSQFAKKSSLALAVARVLKKLTQSPEFHSKPIASDSKLSKICKALTDLAIIPCPNLDFADKSLGEKRFKRAALRDCRIDLFNCLFWEPIPAQEAAYARAVDKILALFDSGVAQNCITQGMLQDQNNKFGGRESLKSFLTFSDTDRFKKRVIRIAKVVDILDPKTLHSLLASWAVDGLYTTRAEYKTYCFDSAHLTSSAHFDKENFSLEMRVALCLAELRKKCLTQLIDNESETALLFLESKVAKDLALTEGIECTDDNATMANFRNLSEEQIITKTLQSYTVEKMVQHIMHEINKAAPSRIPIASIKAYLATLPIADQTLTKAIFDHTGMRVTQKGTQLLLFLLGYLEL